MSKTKPRDESPSAPPSEYKKTLYDLRVQLVKLQSQVIRKSLKGHEHEAHEREKETGLRAQL